MAHDGTVRRMLTYQNVPLWRHVTIVQWATQILSAIVVVTLVTWFFANIGAAIDDRDIPFTFTFLGREYQTPMGISFLPYDPSDTFLYALVVASANTAIVAIIGVILATLLGIVIGVSRLSGNWLVAKLAMAYIEFFRNVPLLVQLLFWFFTILALPTVRESYVVADLLYINNSGISFPAPHPTNFFVALTWLVSAALAVVAGVIGNKRLTQREIDTGKPSYPFIMGIVIALGIMVFSWLVLSLVSGNPPFAISVPEPMGRFGRLSGGYTLWAGLVVLLIGLVMYTAAFIAEIVRAGIQSVGRGQVEAARALGLPPLGALRTVIFPQALRVIIPPLISQCLNLTKNSSLGGAVGYSDLTSVALTMTQTAPAIVIFILIMASYLAMSLTWSLIGNIYNRRTDFGRRRR